MKNAIFGFISCVLAMLVIGIVMLFSTGAFATDAHGDPTYFIKRQSLWLGIGLVICLIVSFIDYQLWQRYWKVVFGAAILLLALCYVFPPINGSHRWLRFGPFSFQPSEIGKIAVIAFIAQWFSRHSKESGEFLKGFVYPIAVSCIILALIAFEEDLGATALIGAAMVVTMFLAGSNIIYLGISAMGGIAGILTIAWLMPDRVHRLLAFRDLDAYKQGSGLQQYQGLIAFGSGGVEGLGLGNGRQKMEFLPFAHTDFIFPMIGEELGLTFTLAIVFCYLVLVICGITIAMNASDRFGALFGSGLIFLIALQAAINIGVTTALLPNKGIPLPFISYGGSNMLFCLLAVGIILNIYRQGVTKPPKPALTKLSSTRVLTRI
ncbi:MAG TPA: putative lipid II flippase FtsW [Chthoniobacteraceae bacterium]|nr:putative lipid II flippase FtsW [Chthoniobacteraceae bacterium]